MDPHPILFLRPPSVGAQHTHRERETEIHLGCSSSLLFALPCLGRREEEEEEEDTPLRIPAASLCDRSYGGAWVRPIRKDAKGYPLPIHYDSVSNLGQCSFGKGLFKKCRIYVRLSFAF